MEGCVFVKIHNKAFIFSGFKAFVGLLCVSFVLVFLRLKECGVGFLWFIGLL
jgi:hypothetical protein